MRSIHLKERRNLMDLFVQITELCQDLKVYHFNIILKISLTFTKMIILLGEFFFDLRDYNKSTYLLRQAQITAELLD
jgi:hypothetical protein